MVVGEAVHGGARRRPRPHATGERANDPVVADPEQLDRRLLERLPERLGQHEGHGRAERHEPADHRREAVVELDVQGTREVAGRELVPRAGVDDVCTRGRCRTERHHVQGRRHSRPAQDRGPGAVDRGHRLVIGRIGAEPAKQGVPERGLVRAPRATGSCRRSVPIVEVRGPSVGPAEQKLPAPWVGRTATSSGRPARARSDCELGTRQALGRVRAQEVRPTGTPHQQAAAGQHGRWRGAAVGEHLPGQVLRRVARGRAGHEPQATDLDGRRPRRRRDARRRSGPAPAPRSRLLGRPRSSSAPDR